MLYDEWTSIRREENLKNVVEYTPAILCNLILHELEYRFGRYETMECGIIGAAAMHYVYNGHKFILYIDSVNQMLVCCIMGRKIA